MNALHMCCMQIKYGITHLASSSTPQAASSLQLQSVHFDVASYIILLYLECDWAALPIHRLTLLFVVSGAGNPRPWCHDTSLCQVFGFSTWAKWLPNHKQTRTKIRLTVWDFESLLINCTFSEWEAWKALVSTWIIWFVYAKEQRRQESWGNQSILYLA